MRAKVESEWKDYNVTTRDVIGAGDIRLSISCDGCRKITQLDPWKVGERLADTPLQRLRLRCKACGIYPTQIEIERVTPPRSTILLTIPLNPALWDDGHETAQRQAKAKAAKRWEASNGRQP